MHCVKLLGRHLMARDFDRQVAVLNGYTVLGINTRKGLSSEPAASK